MHETYVGISQNVNRFVDIPTFTKAFSFKLVQINVNLTKNLTDLKHRHSAGAFFHGVPGMGVVSRVQVPNCEGRSSS